MEDEALRGAELMAAPDTFQGACDALHRAWLKLRSAMLKEIEPVLLPFVKFVSRLFIRRNNQQQEVDDGTIQCNSEDDG